MQVAVEVPIKARGSTRVPNKNFRELSGKPLSWWLLDEITANFPADWDIFVDSEDESVWDKLRDRYGQRLKFHQRHSWFASDAANGNHLIHQFAVIHPEYDVYLQAHVTAVTLSGKILREAVDSFVEQLDRYDSMLIVTEEVGWYWLGDKPVNYSLYQADGFGRSQDSPMYKESTGIYAVTRETAFRLGCRVGRRPLLYPIPRQYAVDIDTMDDFREAEHLLGEANVE